jgi:hypothetical protein
MIEKVDGVLLDLNETEDEVLARLLNLAERHLSDFGRMPKGDGRYYSKDASVMMAKAVITELREKLALDGPPQERDVEEWRREQALERDDHHVNAERVLCVYDRCSSRYSYDKKQPGHVWEQALAAGWKILERQYTARGDRVIPPSADLVCEAQHDEHGCPIYDDEHDCVFWPHNVRL